LFPPGKLNSLAIPIYQKPKRQKPDSLAVLYSNQNRNRLIFTGLNTSMTEDLLRH
jgi:hypothetical protein